MDADLDDESGSAGKKKSDAAGSPKAPSVPRRAATPAPLPKVRVHLTVGWRFAESNCGNIPACGRFFAVIISTGTSKEDGLFRQMLPKCNAQPSGSTKGSGVFFRDLVAAPVTGKRGPAFYRAKTGCPTPSRKKNPDPLTSSPSHSRRLSCRRSIARSRLRWGHVLSRPLIELVLRVISLEIQIR